MQVATDADFEVLDFRVLDVDTEPGAHFQALTAWRL